LKLTLGQVADWIHAEGVFDTRAEAVGYSIDSRTIGAGELFFAVKGERVDGHVYVEAAVADGAVAAVVSQRWLAPMGFDEARLLRVPDECEDCVLDAMQKLARAVRRAWGGRVIGVTGSAGKTTTKECVAEVLGSRFKVLKTEGNFNNHFGLPLTLLRLEPEHQVAVIEMGMNHAGEIAALAKIAEPDWAVVSNVGMAHAEFFADGIEGIARAKYELVEALPEDGLAFLNADDARVRGFGAGMGDQAVLYGTSEGCVVRGVEVEEAGLDGSRFVVEAEGERRAIHLRLMGRHNVLNALAAAAVGVRSGISLEACGAALETMRPTAKRGEVVVWRGAMLIDDCYNSNPRALESMIEALSKTEARRRILIAGEMLELGAEGVRLHRECGAAAAAAGIDVVLGVRGLAEALVEAAKEGGAEAEFIASAEMVREWMRANVREGDVVLLKASRGVRLERALEGLG
jgi:UDP-N-acetylmuramoyl-tripeptide--D-alanyl-D-alanine ligase